MVATRSCWPPTASTPTSTARSCAATCSGPSTRRPLGGSPRPNPMPPSWAAPRQGTRTTDPPAPDPTHEPTPARTRRRGRTLRRDPFGLRRVGPASAGQVLGHEVPVDQLVEEVRDVVGAGVA